MIRIFITLVSVFIYFSAHSQESKQYYDQGLEYARLGKAEDAIKAFDKSIALKPDEYVAWYNRAIAKLMLHHYEDALVDLDKVIMLVPGYKKAYLNRGTTKKHLTDYDGAMADYNYVLKQDSVNMEAYYYRGLLYNLLGKRVQACLDFDKASRLTYQDAKIQMADCIRRPIADDVSIHSILHLTKTAVDDSYGFTPDHPVKVGKGPEGGAENVITYIELLRDAKGKPVKYQRIGTCCPYKTEHALFGNEAPEEKYQISYTTADGAEKTTLIYLSFYDYEDPLILYGMKTILR